MNHYTITFKYDRITIKGKICKIEHIHPIGIVRYMYSVIRLQKLGILATFVVCSLFCVATELPILSFGLFALTICMTLITNRPCYRNLSIAIDDIRNISIDDSNLVLIFTNSETIERRRVIIFSKEYEESKEKLLGYLNTNNRFRNYHTQKEMRIASYVAVFGILSSVLFFFLIYYMNWGTICYLYVIPFAIVFCVLFLYYRNYRGQK